MLRQLGVRAKGAVMPGLNMGIIKGLEIPMPPIELQEEFKRIAALCESFRADLEDSHNTLEALFGSTQQRAFRGELDLSRLKLAPEAELQESPPHRNRPPCKDVTRVPVASLPRPDTEEQLLALEKMLEGDQAEPLPWSEDFFKYRTLSQILKPPLSFAKLWSAVEQDFEQPSYETVKDKVFEYVAEGLLQQEFDEEQREIVFRPRT